jgi:Mg-chelatase subunit ChlD
MFESGAGAAITLPSDGSQSLSIRAANESVELSVKSVAVVAKVGDTEADAGTRFLVLDVSFRNIQKPRKVDDQMVPVQYKVPKLADHFYVVADGRTVLQRVEPSMEGLLSFDELSLEKENDTAAGRIVYQIDAEHLPRSLTLRFYDFAHGHIIRPLAGPDSPAQEKPLGGPLKNQVVEASIFGIKRAAKLGNDAAPAGMTYVLLDFRARSLMSEEVNASDYMPLAKEGEKMTLGTVADWKESRKYAQLVVDGQYAYMPLAQSELIEEPRFLPDIMTGGTLAFLAPADAKSIELRCDFPNAALPSGKEIRPDGLTFAVEGKRPTINPPAPIAKAADEVFAVSIIGQASPKDFAGVAPDEGQRLLVIDVSVKNNGKKQEFFQAKEQLKYAAESGEQSDPDDLTFAGVHRPPELIYIPVGEVRSFQLVYRIPASETRPRLAYAAVTEGGAAVLTLKPLPRIATPPAPPACDGPSSRRGAGLPREAGERCGADDDDAVPLKPRAHGPAKGLEGVGLSAQRVNEAIDKGCVGLWAFVKKEMADDQVEFGAKPEHILCALALVHGGFHKKNAEFNSTLRGYLSSVELSAEFGIYRTGILCMLIEAYGEPAFEPKLRKAARWLLESQMSTGTWEYTPQVPDSVFAPPPGATGAIQISGGFPPGKRAEPWKRITPAAEGDGDNSVTQYGLLGMLSASRAGIRFDDDMWKLVMNTTRQRQDDDGGWAYNSKSNSYGSMTCAGICALAICRHELGEKDPADDPAIQHGLAWLDKFFKVDEHPHETGWYFYYMYSLERVGRILDTEFIGVNEWYPLGAASLVGQQKPDGTWAAQDGDEMDPRLASSFALLFLTRATPPLKPVVHTGPGVLRTAAIAPNNQFYIILDASGSMITTMDGKRKFDIARDSIRSLIAQLPADCDVALRVYGHRKTALDEGADEDTELKIPMGKLDKKQFNAVLDSLRARGRTPLALSLDQAATDLGEATAAHSVTVLLLTDGGEDTINPRGNPIKSATEFGKIPNIRFHIVGFDINQPDWSAQLQNIAKASRGSYWPAAKASDLERTVRTAVLGLPDEYVVLSDSGKEIARGRFGQPQQLPEGKYKFQARFAGRDIAEEFWINAGEPTEITFDASQLPPAKP